VDLGVSPFANTFLTAAQLNQPETFYPLRVYVCELCFLVQIKEFESPDYIFNHYAYFSSYSDTWLQHARSYAARAAERFGLTETSQVVEIASNDGYLLQYFVARGIPSLGIEPAANVAAVALNRGIPTIVDFFGEKMAYQLVAQGIQADLIVGNNVLAHVPRPNDFVNGMKILLKPQGIATLEFPHLLRLMAENQFDTIYHEHYSYFSLTTAEQLLARHSLRIFDLEELPTHGGSLRLYTCHAEDSSRRPAANVEHLRNEEKTAGLKNLETYFSFAERVKETKRNLLEFLISARRKRKSVVAYGAPAKGNTLLNYCGVRRDFIDYTVDRSPHKQGHFLPGTQIPIHHPDQIRETKPDFLLVLPWNLIDEIKEQMAHIRQWGGRFVVPIPTAEVHQ
jgi:SAM-dependent methyltransferase